MNTITIRPRWVLQAMGALVISAGLVYVGYCWGGGEGWPDPMLAQSSIRSDPETASALLKELITREMALRRDGLSEFEKVNRIRDWAHANIDISTRSYLLDQNKAFKFYTKGTPEIFTAFLTDQGGVWCGGTAYVLMELYKLFGFRASTIDFGKADVMTHVVTLVEITFEGGKKTVVQDATLNVTYVTDGGHPYDYFEMLSTLLRYEHQRVHVVPGHRRGGDVLVDPNDTDLPSDYVVDFEMQPLRVLSNGIRKYPSRLTMRSFERQFGEIIRSFLRKEGYPGDLLYLFLYPSGGSDPAILNLAQQLIRRN